MGKYFVHKRTIAIILCLVMIMGLTACKKDEQDTSELEKDTIETTGKVLNGEDSDVSGTGIYGIKENTLTSALNSIRNISDNLDISTEYSRYNEYTEDGYNLITSYTAKCVPKQECLIVNADFKLYVSMEYRGDNKYPTSLTVSYDYTDSKDNNTASEWAYKLVNLIINSDVGKKMETCSFGRQPVEAYTTGDVSVNVSKFNDDYTDTLGNKVATFAVELKKNNGDGYYADLDSFSSIDNPEYGLFKIGILSYGEPITTSQNRIASAFNENATANALILSDYKGSSQGIEKAEAYGLWEIAKKEVTESTGTNQTAATNESKPTDTNDTETAETAGTIGKGNLEVKTSSTYDIESQSYTSEYFNIKYTGTNSGIEDAYSEVKNLIKYFTGTELDTNVYRDKSEFAITIDESGFNDSWGYPVTAKVVINKLNSRPELELEIESMGTGGTVGSGG